MARSGLSISGRDLAGLAGLGYATVARFESGVNIAEESREKLELALIEAGAKFSRRGGLVGVTVPDKSRLIDG